MATTREALARLKKEKVRFLRLMFTDFTGANKNVEVPDSQFEKALNGEIMFDGSSIEGFVRIQESDMLLKPDLDTLRIFPWDDGNGRVARLICDVYNPDDTPFDGCPRLTLRRVIEKAKKEGLNLILLDVMMPDLDGHQVLYRLKHDVDTQHIPIVVVSARRDTRSILKAQRLGMADYVMKPFSFKELLSIIDRHGLREW